MRLICGLVGAAAATLACVAGAGRLGAQPAPPAGQGAGGDVLGELVVEAGRPAPRLPKIGVVPSLSSSFEDVTLRSVVRRDLELSGEFDLLPDSAAPEGLYLGDAPVDVAAWAAKGVEAVVKVGARARPPGAAELAIQVYLAAKPGAPALEQRLQVPTAEVRVGAHRAADLVIGALTGTSGGFASRMTFVMGAGASRRAYVIDADGHDAKAASPPGLTALSPAFGPGGELFYAGGARGDVFGVFSATRGPIPISVRGSVYGLAFSPDGSKVALSIGVGSDVKIFAGPALESVAPASNVAVAVHPTFTPGGDLAFVGEGRYGPRIYLNGKPISPEGVSASSPVFCDHPSGVRAVFDVPSGAKAGATALVATWERGGPLARLTGGQGSDSDPACSPDGRLVAFFSTRAAGEGPGLYIMRLSGGRPKRISPLVGDSLQWGPRLAPRAAP